MDGEIRISEIEDNQYGRKKFFNFDGGYGFKNEAEFTKFEKTSVMCEICGKVELNPLYNIIIQKLDEAGLLREKKVKRKCCFCFNQYINE